MKGTHTLMFLSLSPSFPLSLKINKNLKKQKRGGIAILPLGCWGTVTGGCSLFGCREPVSSVLASSNFQSWGQAQKSEMAVMFNKVIGLLGKWCHHSKWAWLCPFSHKHFSIYSGPGVILSAFHALIHLLLPATV